MYTKSHIVSILLLLVSVAASAQYSTDRVNHYLALSLGGGESNTFTSFAGNSSFSKDQAGGNALFNIAYELRKDQFFFGLGVGVAYNYTWQKTEPFCNTFSRTDREGDDIIYTYQYTDYCDRQHVLSVGIPVYFGGYIGSYAYILAGAKFSFPIFADHYTTTMLSTNGTYTRFIHTIENAPTYGYFPAEEYAYSQTYTDPVLQIAPMMEAGARLPLHSRRIEMRLGVYAEYHIPISYIHNLPLVDYSQMPTTPANEQTLQDMHNLLIFNPLTQSNLQGKTWSQLTVGIKWTCLFNLTRQTHPCRCLEM